MAAVLAFVVGWLVLATTGVAVAPSDAEEPWDGRWHEFWRDGRVLGQLQQEGDRVTGTYRPGAGEISGAVEGARLTGSWSRDGGGGAFSFALAPDRGSFAGRYENGAYRNGAYRNGARIDPESFRPAPFIVSDTPRAALCTILLGADATVAGDSGASLVFEPLLIHAGPRTAAEGRQAR
jgi:hypothetical protein